MNFVSLAQGQIVRLMTALLLCALAAICNAATGTEIVQLQVPKGFDGPISATPQDAATTVAYVRHSPGLEHSTLLQITTYDFGSRLAGIPKTELGNGAESYLMQFLGGVERERTEFHASKPMRVTLGGIPAARVEWSGIAQGKQMSGVMYCVIVGTVVVSFHTQGFADSPPSDRTDALRAIDSVKFRGKG